MFSKLQHFFTTCIINSSSLFSVLLLVFSKLQHFFTTCIINSSSLFSVLLLVFSKFYSSPLVCFCNFTVLLLHLQFSSSFSTTLIFDFSTFYYLFFLGYFPNSAVPFYFQYFYYIYNFDLNWILTGS